MKYPKLFSPIALSPNCVLKNRIVKTGQSTWRWNQDGSAEGSAGEDLYENIARGGAAAVIIGGCAIEDTPGIYLGLWDDKFLPGLRHLADKVHKYDCKIFAQFHHSGPAAWPRLGALPISSSSLGLDEIPMKPPLANPCREMTLEEIREKQRQIVEACVRADQGGFDGMEIHVAHGYLLNSFVSRVWNHRTDEYGAQNVENRTRIVREIFEEARRRCRPGFVLGVRMNGREYGAKGAITIEEAVENARAFEAMGAQFINVAGYGYGEAPFRYCPDYFPYPEPEDFMKPYMDAYRGKGLWTDSASHIKKAVNVPVITAGRMNEDLAEKVLEDGDADIIGIGRGLWADPEMPRKILEGRPEDIVRCTRCASCEDPVTQPRICRVNPSLGREKEMDMSPAATKKKVMVIGGGPAGMEAARVAALRGHEVTLYEKTGALGGRIKLASMIKGCEVEDVMPIYDYLTTQIRKLPVTVKLNTTVTRELVLREKPDAVVIATSSEYAVPDIPGIHSSRVFTIKGLSRLAALPLRLFGPRLLARLSHIFLPVGKRVVVLGGQIEGVQGAVFLKKRGRDVTIVEEGETWGAGIPERYFQRIGPWFNRKNVRVLTKTRAEEITKEGVRVRAADGTVSVLPCDSVMVLMPQVPSHALAESLKGVVGEIHEIGSTLGAENGLLKHALYDGRLVGCRL
ncbi:FAD-dependent oxidoreductase [uncultured Mailhella sp.]|uniref:oxidoreductase n=1 Tax=uncultured Mailhella sp. TaxID=1981031 RepID=UPI0025D77A7D|nr:FAD-dependent oxidoreductase [uncultured Mailhella sp.]